jgi:hypothetical protein
VPVVTVGSLTAVETGETSTRSLATSAVSAPSWLAKKSSGLLNDAVAV